MSDADQSYWDAAQTQVPDYPVFHRVQISDEDRVAQAVAEQDALAGFDALFSDAEEVTVNNDGSFSATFNLTQDYQRQETGAQRFGVGYLNRST